MSDISEKATKAFSDLRFVRIFDPVHIPYYLVEQIKSREFTPEQFFSYQKAIALVKTPTGPALNQNNFLYVIMNPKNVAVGFLWASYSELDNALNICNFSMDKEYWFQGMAVSLLHHKIVEIMENFGIDKVYWTTKYPKHSQKYGYKPSKYILMEYERGKDGKADGRDERSECINSEPSTEPNVGAASESAGSGLCEVAKGDVVPTRE